MRGDDGLMKRAAENSTSPLRDWARAACGAHLVARCGSRIFPLWKIYTRCPNKVIYFESLFT